LHLSGTTIACVVLAASACRDGAAVPAPLPVRPSLSTTEYERDRPTTLRYSWSAAPGLPPIGPDSRAFVHFVYEGRLVGTDDHVPQPPPSEWKPGQTYEYTRARFIPAPRPSGEIEVRVGLFTPVGRLAIAGEHTRAHEYIAGRLREAPARAPLSYVYREGWYEPDAGPARTYKTWMGQKATVTFDNPGTDAIVYLEAETERAAFPETPALRLQIGDYAASLPIREDGVFVAGIRFPREALGHGRSATLRLAMNGSFVPQERGSSADTRRLGLCVHHLAVESAGSPTPEGVPVVESRRLPLLKSRRAAPPDARRAASPELSN
jgi:hypothetical protein